MPVTYQQAAGLLRFVPEAKPGDPHPPYDAICTVVWGPTGRRIGISGLMGTLNRRYLRELLHWMVENKVDTIVADRATGHRLPKAMRQPDGSYEISVIDLAARYGAPKP